MRERTSHEKLVEGLIQFFSEKGLQIQYARKLGYERPFVIKRHAPDVFAYDKEKKLGFIGEAKLCTELEEQITKEEFEDFGKMVMKSGNSEKVPLPFYIAVPSDCQTKVKETFRMFEIPWKNNIQVLPI